MKRVDNQGYPIPYKNGDYVEALFDMKPYFLKGTKHMITNTKEDYFCINGISCSYDHGFKRLPNPNLNQIIKNILNESR